MTFLTEGSRATMSDSFHYSLELFDKSPENIDEQSINEDTVSKTFLALNQKAFLKQYTAIDPQLNIQGIRFCSLNRHPYRGNSNRM
jgi:hypothetical protein